MVLKLEILKHNDSTSNLNNLEIEFNYNDCDTSEATFYKIDVLFEVFEDGKYWTEIFVGGNKFITSKRKSEIETEILKQNNLSNFTI